jgi:hypothetical protein
LASRHNIRIKRLVEEQEFHSFYEHQGGGCCRIVTSL